MANATNDKIYTAVDATRREINLRIDNLETKIDNNYVTHTELEPIKRIVYGMVTIILIAFVTALVALVVRK